MTRNNVMCSDSRAGSRHCSYNKNNIAIAITITIEFLPDITYHIIEKNSVLDKVYYGVSMHMIAFSQAA